MAALAFLIFLVIGFFAGRSFVKLLRGTQSGPRAPVHMVPPEPPPMPGPPSGPGRVPGPPGPAAERTCLFCEGAGQRDCPFCDEGKRADPISGQAADCRHCDGAGSIVCRACRGTGKLGGQPPAPIR
ncbi:MAG: hypothetical protein ACE5R4_18310 [Armatimonadota bacterium]